MSVITLTSTAVLALGAPTALGQDDDEFEQPPGYEAPEAPEVDPEAAGLELSEGATLAEPRVLDIKGVIQDLSGETDTDTDTGGGEEPPPEDDSSGGGSGTGREEVTSGQHKFTLQTDVLFAEGSGEITEDARGALEEVAAAIDQYHPSEVNIFGFTDDQGSYDSGRVLSDERAQNTHLELLELIQDPTGIVFNVRGYSEDYPLYDNTTEEGRQMNRRVEISWPTEE
jgi:outer membrane protein OmpA-like peptidoglycan-associated protein